MCKRRVAREPSGRCDHCWRNAVGSRREPDRADAARSPDLPGWALATLAADRSSLVRAEIAVRDDLPDRLIAALANPAIETGSTVLRRIAKHPRLGEHARLLVQSDDLIVLRQVAQNPGTPLDTLKLLAEHPDQTVHLRARTRVMGAGLDEEQRHRLPVGLRHLLR
jgi:hypothetical protein